MLELGVKFLLSYCTGSIMGAMVVGQLRGGVDIRDMGSGNAGGTNALRTQGRLFALGVIIIDIGKGAIGAGIIPGLHLPLPADNPPASPVLLTYLCAAAAVAGHVWPIWHRFRGGKGAATLIGTLAVLAPVLLLPVLITWLLTLTLFGYVGLATIAGGMAAPAFLAATRLPADQPLFFYALGCAAYLLYTHRSNVQRMRAGVEPQNPRVMLFKRRTQSGDAP
jgi:glycerol-3-phosphate acyltransferase PlsY